MPHAHNADFLAALDMAHIPEAAQSSQPAAYWVARFIGFIESDEPNGPLPEWTTAPGSPAGLKCIAAIMEALGYKCFTERGILFASLERSDSDHSSHYFYLAFTPERFALCQWASGEDADWYLRNGWKVSDPDTLPRALHLAVSLRPAATGGDHV